MIKNLGTVVRQKKMSKREKTVVLDPFCPSSLDASTLLSVMPHVLAALPHTQPPIELFPQQIPLFADSLQHGAILLGPAQQIRKRVVYGTVWH